MTTYVGTKRVGRVPVVVLGPLDQEVLLQNQSPMQMVIWFHATMEENIDLLPFQRIIAPAGTEGVLAAAPIAKGTQTYQLFYSSLVQPITPG